MNNMAKLNVVIPAVEVTVGNVTYRKVDRKAQAGDIVMALTDADGDITQGAFYGVFSSPSGKLAFRDDVNDAREYQLRTLAHNYEVYAPISEPAAQQSTDTITFEGATWRKVDRDVREGDAIKFTDDSRPSYVTESELYVVDYVDSCDDPQITDDDEDEFDAGSEDYEVYEKVAEEKAVEYREVKRKAAIGERIKITNRVPSEDRYKNGDEFVVNSADSDGDVRVTAAGSDRTFVMRIEYVVLEPVTAEPTKKAEPDRLAVGDYARVINLDEIDGSNTSSYVQLGDIFEIIEDDESHSPFRGKRVIDGVTAWFKEPRLVRATDEEVAAAKDPRSQFVAGDKVRLISGGGDFPLRGFNDGELYTVSDPKNKTHGNSRVKITRASGNTGFALPSQIVKLTAAEIAEIERKQAEETKWAAIGREVNEYKVGDIVQYATDHAEIVPVIALKDYGVSVKTKGYGICTEKVSDIKLIVPVEQRFDTEEVAAA